MTDEKEIVLAIISEPRFGMNDRGDICLSFHVHDTESSGALQILGLKDAEKMLRAYEVPDVKYLAGKPCWVERSRGLMVYSKPWTRK